MNGKLKKIKVKIPHNFMVLQTKIIDQDSTKTNANFFTQEKEMKGFFGERPGLANSTFE